MEAFRQGLRRGSPLYNELTMYPCKTFEDVQMKAMAFVRLEEDNEPGQTATPVDRMDRKSNNGYRQV